MKLPKSDFWEKVLSNTFVRYGNILGYAIAGKVYQRLVVRDKYYY